METRVAGNRRVIENLIFAGLSIWAMFLLVQTLQEALAVEARFVIGLLTGVVVWALFARSTNYLPYAFVCAGFILGYYLSGYNDPYSTIFWRVKMGGVGVSLILLVYGCLLTATDKIK